MSRLDLREWKDQWENGYVKFVPELFELVEKQQEVIEKYERATQGFEKEYMYEHGFQVENAKPQGQWHKGALEGFEHIKRIFDKYFNVR